MLPGGGNSLLINAIGPDILLFHSVWAEFV